MRNSAEWGWLGWGLLLLGCSTEAAPIRVEQAGTIPPAATCVDDLDCDDGLVCSGLERCLQGRCWSGRPPACDDGNACTLDLCLEPFGCAHELTAQCLPDAAVLDASVAGDASGLLDAARGDADAAGYAGRVPDFCAGSLVRGDVIVSEAATLESLRGVRCIDGNVTLQGALLESLLPLSSLRWIGGHLKVLDATQLEQLTGLDLLEAVDGDVELRNWRASQDGAPLSSLREVGGALRISRWTKTVRLRGFKALTRVHGELAIEGLPLLEDVAGAFGALVQVDGELRLKELPKLTSLDGFNALTHLGAALKLELAITTFQGFGALELYALEVLVPKTVTVFRAFQRARELGGLNMDVPDMVRFEGLPALEKVSGGGLSIVGRKLQVLNGFPTLREATNLGVLAPSLKQLAGFDALERVTGNVTFRETALTTVSLPALVEAGGVVLIDNPLLGDISAFAKLRDTGKKFHVGVERNPLLTDLRALNGHAQRSVVINQNRTLRELGWDAARSVAVLSINANPALSRCEVELLRLKYMPEQSGQLQLGCNRGCTACDGASCKSGDGVVTEEHGYCPFSLTTPDVDLSLYTQAHTVGSISLTAYDGPRTDLGQIKRVLGSVKLQDAVAEDLGMFRALEEIRGDLTLTRVTTTQLDALDRLRNVQGGLVLSSLPIASLGLPSLQRVGARVEVANCLQLSTCQATWLEAALAAQQSTPEFEVYGLLECAGSCQEGVCH